MDTAHATLSRCRAALLLGLLLASCGSLPAAAPPSFGQTRADGAIRLTTPPAGASDQNPAYSPAGSRLVLTRFDNGYNMGPAGLFTLTLPAGVPARLTPAEDQDNVNLPGAAWNGPRDRIVLSSDRSDIAELWSIAPDGSDFAQITTHAGLPAYFEPSWSPDGQWIVFESSQPGSSDDGAVGRIFKVRADGTGLAALTDGTWDDRQPNWSPAGDRIVFQRRALPDGPWDLYTMAPDGSGLLNVTATPDVDETDVSWSPDGACLVYSSDPGSLPLANLFVLPAAGGTPTRLTFSPTNEDGAPSWSPDGLWVAFESHELADPDSPTALWRIAVPAGTCGEPHRAFLPLSPRSASAPPDLAAVDDFLYQLQDIDLTAIGATAYDLVVMDYSSDGGPAGEFTAAEIAALQDSPGGPKLVLAYMSIGEAETYRFYWDPAWDADGDGLPDPGAPSWLDIENPDWEGNYKVRYWDPGWQAIVFLYTDRLLAAGFDGAYLDIIDAYEYYAQQGRTTAAQEMADFVAAVRAHARGVDPAFTIVPQNAPELAALVPAYLDALDGIAQEDIYYGYDADNEPTPPTITAELEGYLDPFVAAGKLVLTIDYADYRLVPAYVDDAYARSQARGYVPFCTVRDLDELIVNPGHAPD